MVLLVSLRRNDGLLKLKNSRNIDSCSPSFRLWMVIINTSGIKHNDSQMNLKLQNINRSDKTIILGSVLFKTHNFTRHPCPNIILGDSRAVLFSIDTVFKLTGDKYFNLGIPGGHYNTMIDNFWFAESKIKLKNVYVAI